MTPMFLCALLGASANAVPPEEGDLARALPFVSAAVGEDTWTAYRGPEHRGHYRVVASAYSRDANHLDLVVYWQARNPPEDPNRAFAAVDPVVREGTTPQVLHGETDPATPGALGPGEISGLIRSRYNLPATAQPDNLWWDVGGDPEVVRVHLRPHLSTPKKALLPPQHTWQSQRSDAQSEAEPKLSVLKPTEDGRGCDWFVQPGPHKPLQRLAGGKQGCNLTYVALRPDGKKAIVDAMRPEEIDLSHDAHTPVHLPGLPDSKGFAGYTDRGDISVIFGKSTIRNNVIADPVLYTRFNQRGGRWAQADTLAVHHPICDTFMARRTTMAQDMTCQYLHIATAYTSPCQPLDLSHDGCNTPQPTPPSDALLALLDPNAQHPLSGQIWAHKKRWVVLETPWASVVAALQTQASTTPVLEQPVVLLRAGKLQALEDFTSAGPVTVAIRGPYLLVGRADVPAHGPHHFLGQQGPDRVYRLYDLRTGQVLDTFGPDYHSIAFWPVGG